MTKKSHSVLPKKLSEIGRQIDKASSIQLDDPTRQLIHADVEQRLTFVKNLLAAETASHPTRQSHLEHLKERIQELETLYRVTRFISSTFSSIDNVENVAVIDDEYDHVSKCSMCNESDVSNYDDIESMSGQGVEGCVDLGEEKKERQVVVFDNVLFDVDRVEDGFYDRVETIFDDVSRNDASFDDEEKEIRADVDVEESGKKGEGLGFGKLWWAVVSGIMIGMLSVSMLEGIEYDVYEGLLKPT